MDEEKKEIEIGIVILIVLVVAIALAPVVFSLFSSSASLYFDRYEPIILAISQNAFGWILGVSIPVSVLSLIGIVAAVEGTKHVRRKEAELYDAKVETAYEENVKGDPALTKKWASVMAHADSPNASDWRQAIIEADIILGDILTQMGHQGAGVGEQLKTATKGDFGTLDQAWEAHRIRNQIAHEGSDFALNQHEAKRVVNLYRQVFEEFFYI